MSRSVAFPAIALLSASLLTGCLATRGQLREAQEAQIAALEAERAARAASEAALEQRLRSDLTALRSDVDALRADLTGLRTEFNTTITALGEQLRFAMPVHFGFDEDEVGNEDHAALNRFAQVVQQHYPNSLVTVEGFADPAGSASYNQRLSTRRAESVRTYLVGQGIPEARLRAVGYGETRVVSEGAAATEPGAESNRRVVFVIEGAAGSFTTTMAPR